MKKFAGTLLVCCCVGLAFVQAQTPSAAAPAQTASVSDAVKQIEHDWVDAAKAGDTDKLNEIIADEWIGIDYDGTKETKEGYLRDVRLAGATGSSIADYEFGPMDVIVLGDVAVCQGSDTEKSRGKNSSGKYVWMDVFAKRGGKWVAVRSQSAISPGGKSLKG